MSVLADRDIRAELESGRVRIDPYPFRERPTRFTLVRKLLLQAPFRGNEEFRAAYFGARAELVEITVE